MQAAQTTRSRLKFFTPGKEGEENFNNKEAKENFKRICSKESLTEKATVISKIT